ncbi:hydantoin racemase-like protein [Xylona heveae TC161]|uniref:Hydantoin racemase-like protein n=1 Tax=Xylona heveae (strain CBS 132557 / TC161) TaxID=1328760 RepID=A0A165JY59_XYLHT|nr:hydantoin racemase-like protein [Xylona heveae TC161]KZF26774.1 hydantoin racemase-like protein [Xylona heveae TC161]
MEILIINPNSTQAMTDALKPLVESLGYDKTTYTFFTAPSGPKSINDEGDAVVSVDHCVPSILPMLETHDAFLVACYSEHPLVPILRERTSKPVTGIFESSVTAALHLMHPWQKFGIVSTGKVWEEILTNATAHFLGFGEISTSSVGGGESKRFAGVETTGLSAVELHDVSADVVREKMINATKRLLGKGAVGAICLGCAGMSGMDEIVRTACIEELGEAKGSEVRIVDGVKAGVATLEGLVRASF